MKDILRLDKTPISQFEILMIVNESKGLKVGELSQKMSITRPNLTPLVDNLEKEGLLKRVTDKKDKRITRLYLTEKGEKQIAENFKVIEERLDKISTDYTDDELAELKESCESILNILN